MFSILLACFRRKNLSGKEIERRGFYLLIISSKNEFVIPSNVQSSILPMRDSKMSVRLLHGFRSTDALKLQIAKKHTHIIECINSCGVS